ncbi:hypothetical protein DMW20_11870 [Vibrio parahaemolyticus]|nr:hypothetical protein [Vibrio parahaemolyticus]
MSKGVHMGTEQTASKSSFAGDVNEQKVKHISHAQLVVTLLKDCFEGSMMIREHSIQTQAQLVGIQTAQSGESPECEHISPDSLLPYVIERLKCIKHIQTETIEYNEMTLKCVEVSQ